MTDLDRFIDAADALAEAVAFWEQAEEPDVSVAIYRLKRTAAKYRAALAALSPTGGNDD